MINGPVRRALFAVDVERSGDVRRDNVAWDELKRALHRAVQVAFAASGIDLARLQVRDTGDGMIVDVPDTVDRGRLLHPLLAVLAQELRTHNQRASQTAQIRVRVALHDADVTLDESGFPNGPQMVILARLLDSARLRDELRRAPATATVAAILSDRFHGSVVRHGYPGVDAELFHQVEVRTKETTATGWIHLPGHQSRPRRPRRALALAVAAAVIVLVVVGVVWLVPGRGDQNAGGNPGHPDTASTHPPAADLTTTVPTTTAPTSSRPTTVVTTTPVGKCTDLYFEQEPKISTGEVQQLPEGVTAERVYPGLSQFPTGGLFLRDRKPLGAIKFYYEDPGLGFAVVNVVDATCAPVQSTSKKVAADTYVASFRLGAEDFELVVKLNGLADVTFRRP
ncbi:hypothetical protein F0L68_24845 [Solihabitans fulvus]|uniref:Guanylate cyclase domain-containing protein n=1 Tax=Solihabitans fulvus TaxID=1892852 RepID=A0A5B2X2X5_9PSEU|nr:hypothetical protein [Solihabitans fulvus]KAA2257529.1 hypothetical protein F0L68_24845 [Solihabitans fulvus]